MATGGIVKKCDCCGAGYTERQWSALPALGTVGYRRGTFARTIDYRQCPCGDAMGRTIETGAAGADGNAERRAA